MHRAVLAWKFKSSLSLAEALRRLPGRWMERDSDYKPDSISGGILSGSSARIFHIGKEYFIVNLFVESADSDLEHAVQEARDKLFATVLPVLAAREIGECEPVD